MCPFILFVCLNKLYLAQFVCSYPIYIELMLSRIFESESEIELVFGAMYKAEITDILDHGVLVTFRKGMKPILLKNRFVNEQKFSGIIFQILEGVSLLYVLDRRCFIFLIQKYYCFIFEGVFVST